MPIRGAGTKDPVSRGGETVHAYPIDVRPPIVSTGEWRPRLRLQNAQTATPGFSAGSGCVEISGARLGRWNERVWKLLIGPYWDLTRTDLFDFRHTTLDDATGRNKRVSERLGQTNLRR